MSAERAKTKKELIREKAEELRLFRVYRRDLERINEELRKKLGENGATSISYIANVLIEAGYEVFYSDFLVERKLPPDEAELFDELIKFKDFPDAEESIKRMSLLYREFRKNKDRGKLRKLRQLADTARRRALLIADNEKVAEEKRRKKREIAFWFELFKENPELFPDWLELRRSSPEFKKRFGG
jgi:hypothetical protein